MELCARRRNRESRGACVRAGTTEITASVEDGAARSGASARGGGGGPRLGVVGEAPVRMDRARRRRGAADHALQRGWGGRRTERRGERGARTPDAARTDADGCQAN